METIYYRLDAKRLTCSGVGAEKQVSGGEPVCYAFVPWTRPTGGKTGVVVDFQAYRQAQVQEQVPSSPSELPRRRRSRMERVAGLGMELCATGAIVALVVGMLIRFFTL